MIVTTKTSKMNLLYKTGFLDLLFKKLHVIRSPYVLSCHNMIYFSNLISLILIIIIIFFYSINLKC